MKKYILLLTGCLALACQVQRPNDSRFISVYTSGPMPPSNSSEYMILRTKPQIFEIYSPIILETTLGEWTMANDTLYLTPKYSYGYSKKHKDLVMQPVDVRDSTVLSIPMKYLIKNNRLIDKTDYSFIFSDFFPSVIFEAKEIGYTKMQLSGIKD